MEDSNNSVQLVLWVFNVNTWTNIDAFLAVLSSISIILAIIFYFIVQSRKIKNYIRSKSILKTNYILVCGLDKKASYYIDSEIDRGNRDIIVIEKNPDNLNIDKYLVKGVAVKIGDATDSNLLRKLNIINAKHIVALAGKDTTNLEIALTVKDVLKDVVETHYKILKDFYMHVEDRDLNIFYKDGGLLDDESKLLVKMFSMSRNSAKSLFLKHDIDGDSRQYIDSNKSFGIVVVGNTDLALEVIGQTCEIAHFPNENDLIIYCVDNNIKDFEKLVKHKYHNIDLIPNIQLVYRELEYNSTEFYNDEVWQKDITNVILCYEDAQKNLDIAAQLADTTYFTDINNDSMQTKILIAIYDNEKIAENIQINKGQYKYFDVFAETSKMASCNMIIDESYETIAKCIHAAYNEDYNPWRLYNKYDPNSKQEYIESQWVDVKKLSDRDSSRAQAYHIPVKLKAMGLIEQKGSENLTTFDRLKFNRDIFDSKKDFLGINANNKIINERNVLNLDDASLEEQTKEYSNSNSREKIKKFNEYYFPKNFDPLFVKLIRSEHNRWNVHHYLKGWNYSEKEDKKSRRHDCLLPLSNLAAEKQYTVLYDIYSILYIPNFLAKVNYELKIPLKIGVTGHRELGNSSKIIDLLRAELEKISLVYDFQEIITPLAEGADTSVAKYLLDNYADINMIVPMPMNEKTYLQQFLSDKGRNEFKQLKKKASNSYTVTTSNDENMYLATGKEVVDKCNLLVAVWDGKPPRGLGGTGDIVAYAKQCKKAVLHINPDNLEVKKINFGEVK